MNQNTANPFYHKNKYGNTHRRALAAAALFLVVFLLLIVFQFSCRTSAAEISPPVLEEQALTLVDTILSAVIEEGMNDYEKCCAVYDYLHAIPYINYVYSEDWKENGYKMLLLRGGDCYGYYGASRLLLERLGYQVIETRNCNGFNHVWCMVSTDRGRTWLHFDPTCWRWGSDGYLCMISDEELESYASVHVIEGTIVSHDWDRQKAAADIEAFAQKIKMGARR